MTPADIANIMAKWRIATGTPELNLRNEIARHNAEVERKKAAKKARKAGFKPFAPLKPGVW